MAIWQIIIIITMVIVSIKLSLSLDDYFEYKLCYKAVKEMIEKEETIYEEEKLEEIVELIKELNFSPQINLIHLIPGFNIAMSLYRGLNMMWTNGLNSRFMTDNRKNITDILDSLDNTEEEESEDLDAVELFGDSLEIDNELEYFVEFFYENERNRIHFLFKNNHLAIIKIEGLIAKLPLKDQLGILLKIFNDIKTGQSKEYEYNESLEDMTQDFTFDIQNNKNELFLSRTRGK